MFTFPGSINWNIKRLNRKDRYNHEDWQEQEIRARWLGRFGGERAIEPLIEKLSCGILDSKVWQAVVDALVKLGTTDAQIVQAHLRAVKNGNENSAEALEVLGDQGVVEPLVRILSDDYSIARCRSASLLGKLGSRQAVGHLIERLSDEYSGVRICAAEALGRLNDKRAVEPLIRSLTDEEYVVCQHAARALGDLGDGLAVEPLISMLSDENWDEVRTAAAAALGKLRDKRAVDPLIGLLSDSSMAAAAATALGELDDKRAVEPLLKLLPDTTEWGLKSTPPKDLDSCSISAIKALGQLGDTRAVHPLLNLLPDLKWSLRELAKASLEQLKAPVDAVMDNQRRLLVAVEANDIKTVEVLIKDGVSIRTRDTHGDAAQLLHLAATGQDRDIEMAQFLLDHNAPVNGRNDYGQTPLHIAAQYCNKAIGKLLLAHGANINAVDNGHLTPLYSCSRFLFGAGISRMTEKEIDMAIWFLGLGADPNPRVVGDMTFLQYALHRNDPALVALIESWRARS